MRTLRSLVLDANSILNSLNELDEFLQVSTHKKERSEILPFVKHRSQLCAAFGMLNPHVSRPDLYATELDLFGDFVCDAASGDSVNGSYSLIEFESAEEQSIFTRLTPGKVLKRYAPRFEHGFSQLVDWAWRLSTEGNTSDAFRRIFSAEAPSIHLVLVAGRDSDLSAADIARLRWRSNEVVMGGYRMYAYTFDGALRTLRDKMWMVQRDATL